MTRRAAWAVASALFGVLFWAAAATAAPVFTLYVEKPGVISVSHQQLAEQGLRGSHPSAMIGVRNLGRPVPRWVDDGGDGSFDHGDRVLFTAEALWGTASSLDEYSRYNAYLLDLADEAPLPGRSEDRAGAVSGGSPLPLAGREHFEQDLLMLRFAESPTAPIQRWYWAKLAHVGAEPFRVDFDLAGLDELQTRAGAAQLSALLRAGGEVAGELQDELRALFNGEVDDVQTLSLRVLCRGWSLPRMGPLGDMAHHALELRLNRHLLGRVEWSGQAPFEIELPVPLNLVRAAGNQLELVVPQRPLPNGDDLLVDVLVVDWVEVEYPRSTRLGAGQARVFLADDGARGTARLELSGHHHELFTSDGRRIHGAGGAEAAWPVAEDAFPLWAVADRAYRAPDEIVLDRPSTLRDGKRQADYIVISHHSLMEAVAPLVELHRQRGLEVVVADVQDVYDEFNHGIIHPRALRDFLSFAYHSWSGPPPRFVLLVGDASWDFKNPLANDANYADWTYTQGETDQFVKNASTPYAAGSLPNNRNLVPTWSYPTSQGHAASDNWFACVDGDDAVPELAVGRLPAATVEELAGMVAKTIAFISDPEPGPWRRRQLFITNESAAFQRQSDQLAEASRSRGLVPLKIYPSPTEAGNEAHSQSIVDELNGGLQLVHFIGHGGRYIWRTGPPDLAKNHDLFTLEHLDLLTPTRRLPVVLSLTCYSAPFDHPIADSIGEKLIRLPDAGAIAVFAASWRNSPTTNMGRLITEEMARPGATVGEAIRRAKEGFRSPLLNQTYNLLGDPALPVAWPRESQDLELRAVDGGLGVRAAGPPGARAVIELVAEDGRSLAEAHGVVEEDAFDSVFTSSRVAAGETVRGARAYLWDEGASWDAAAWRELPQELAFSGSARDPAEAAAPAGDPAPGGRDLPPAAERPATPDANTLRWTTASEVENFGFEVYRGTSEDGPFERITEQMIPGAGTVDEPQDYVFVDHRIEPGSGYYYYIESISMGGVRERFSPIIFAKPKQ